MIYTRDHKTLDMYDPFPFLGPKRKQRIEESWAKLFRQEILPVLPVEKVFPFYNTTKGAPTKELYAMIGLMILQQMHDLTDEAAVDQFAYNIQWHYALNMTSTADTDAYVSPKTLWTMRSILTEKNLYAPLFESVTAKLADVFSVDTSRQRIDSVHVFSNMRHLGRIGLFVKTIKRFLVNLKRHHNDLYDHLEAALTDRYMTRQGEAVFSMVKPSESMRTLAALADNLFTLIERFKGNEKVAAMSSYQLLTRLLKEQCVAQSTPELTASKVTVKANKEVPSDSLQNPSDPDAGYDGHKGKGYQVQVCETYSTAEEGNTLSLITAVIVEPAHKSDAHALIPLIESTQNRGLGPDEVLADSLYGSDDNCEKANAFGVEVVSPVMGTPPDTGLTASDFGIIDEGTITACPEGYAPKKTKAKNGKHIAVFHSVTCQACPRRNDCPVKPGAKGHYLRYDGKAIRLAKRRAHEKTPEFKDKYRFRSGIEAAISEYDRKTGVKHLRVRGLPAVSFCATLKAAAVNIFRATAFLNRAEEEKRLGGHIIPGLSALLGAVKDQLAVLVAAIRRFFGLLRPYHRIAAHMPHDFLRGHQIWKAKKGI